MIPICRAPKRFVCALGRARRPQPAVKAIINHYCKVQHFSVNTNNGKFGFQHETASKFSSLQQERELGDQEHSTDYFDAPPARPTKASQSTATHLPLIGARGAAWWTGKAPAQCKGFVDGKLYSLPQLSLEGGLSRETIQAYFDNTWSLTEVLLASLQGDAAFVRPPYHELRHPMIFYYGHPAALYINKLRVAGLMKDPINPYFEVIFETGVDEMSWDDLSKNKMSWPSVAEVHTYRKKVHAAVSEVISNISDEDCAKGIDKSSPLWALVMGFEHERIHLETSSVLISEMPVDLTRFPEGLPAYHDSIYKPKASVIRTPVAGVNYPASEMIKVESQSVRLGKPSDFPSFGW